MSKKSGLFRFLTVFIVFAGTVLPAGAAKLYVAATDGSLLRYEVTATGEPRLEGTVGSIDTPVGLTFSRTGELFATSALDNGGGVHRFVQPESAATANGRIADGNLRAPHWAAFRNGELFVAQRDGSNVVRYRVEGGGSPVFVGSITAGLAPRAPRGVAVSPQGEVFVSECCATDRISRYRIDANGTPVPNGTITGNGLRNPHDIAFSPWGEMFVVSSDSNSVSRFLFDAAGAVQPNGQITGAGLSNPLGLTFSPWGELFVSSGSQAVVRRWTFNADRQAQANGSFNLRTPARDIEFGPAGNPSVTIAATGIAPQKVTCENQTTRQSVTIPLSSPSPWTCETAGLVIRPGDAIQINIAGSAN